MGQTIEEMKNITLERIVATYSRFKTARKTAEILGISHPTVITYLKKAGVTTQKSGWVTWNEAKAGKELTKWCEFSKWLTDNPGIRIPRDFTEIARISSLDRKKVYEYFRRRYNKAMHYMRELGDLKKYDQKFKAKSKDDDEYKWSFSSLDTYYMKLDKFEHKVYITGIIEAKEGDFIVSFLPIDPYTLYNICMENDDEL